MRLGFFVKLLYIRVIQKNLNIISKKYKGGLFNIHLLYQFLFLIY